MLQALWCSQISLLKPKIPTKKKGREEGRQGGRKEGRLKRKEGRKGGREGRREEGRKEKCSQAPTGLRRGLQLLPTQNKPLGHPALLHQPWSLPHPLPTLFSPAEYSFLYSQSHFQPLDLCMCCFFSLEIPFLAHRSGPLGSLSDPTALSSFDRGKHSLLRAALSTQSYDHS